MREEGQPSGTSSCVARPRPEPDEEEGAIATSRIVPGAYVAGTTAMTARITVRSVVAMAPPTGRPRRTAVRAWRGSSAVTPSPDGDADGHPVRADRGEQRPGRRRAPRPEASRTPQQLLPEPRATSRRRRRSECPCPVLPTCPAVSRHRGRSSGRPVAHPPCATHSSSRRRPRPTSTTTVLDGHCVWVRVWQTPSRRTRPNGRLRGRTAHQERAPGPTRVVVGTHRG